MHIQEAKPVRLQALLGGLWILSIVLLLLIHGLEIDLRQVHGRKASALNDIGHIGAQIGVDNLRTCDANDGAQLLLWNVTNFKNTGLLGFDQKDRFLLNFGTHRGGHRDFKNTFIDRFCTDLELNINVGLLL